MIGQLETFRNCSTDKKTKYTLIILCVFMIVISKTKSEIFTSLKNVEKLIETEADMIKNVKSVLPQVSDTSKKNKIKKFLTSSIKEYQIAIKDIPHYVGNPVNAFRLIKRLYLDLMIIEDLLKENTYYTRSDKGTYPTIEDLDGAFKGLINLIVIYNLNVTELANGTLISNASRSQKTFVEYVTPMTASDCFELGLAAHEYQEHAISVEWMTAAFHKYHDCDICSFTEFDVVKFICRTYYFMGKKEKFLYWIEKSLTLKLTKQQKEENERLIAHLRKIELKDHPTKSQNRNKVVKKAQGKNEVVTDYKDADLLCLGETSKTINNKSLHCFYKTAPQLFVRLMSFKAEQLHLRPDVTMFHDVISDKEIKEFKRDAGPRLETATVNGCIKSVNKRVAGVAWIYDYSSRIPARVSLRLSLITGNLVHILQKLEISNYGVGGFYAPHYDCNEDYTIPRICLKNKLTVVNPADWREMIGKATGLMFLSDVEQGGATIFPRLGVSVFPNKGSVLIWNNLRRSGRIDHRVIHAGCPVLRGSKWTGTKLL